MSASQMHLMQALRERVHDVFSGQWLHKSNQSAIKCEISYSVFHWFLHKVEALPARVKLMFVRTFEVQQVADNLGGITDKDID